MRLFALALVGCGFTPGVTGSNDAADPDAPDAAIDTPPGPCLPRWYDHTIRFNPPVPIAELNTTSTERDPFFSADERTAYFSSDRPGSAGADVWFATRPSLADAFSVPQLATDINSTAGDGKLSITENGLIAVVSSNRAVSAGGYDVWESTRGSTSMTFPVMSRARLLLVDSAAEEFDPAISADGLHLYLAPYMTPTQHISVASRTIVGGLFSAPVTIGELDSGMGEADPSLSPDERLLVFWSGRPGAKMWYATRASSTVPFEPPLAIPDVNSNDTEGDPHVSADGCRLYFARVIGANWDVVVAHAR